MDPLSQGLLGAIAAQAVAKNEQTRNATACGWLAGMAPDLDIFIKSQHDPLMFVEFHRHFTHALAFIPIGGLICALVFWLLLRNRASFSQIALFSIAGYATHGLLDAMTSYGTSLFLPFSQERIAWDVISIVDPAFTLLILLPFVLIAAWKKSFRIAHIGIVLALAYLGLGAYQHQQIKDEMYQLAEYRGHTIERYKLNPTIGNNIFWRTVYEHNGRYYMDAIRKTPFGKASIYEGESVRKFVAERDYPTLAENSQQRQDIERFQRFSQGFNHQREDGLVVDSRYGLPANSSNSMWAIAVNPNAPDEHVQWRNIRNLSAVDRKLFWQILWGE